MPNPTADMNKLQVLICAFGKKGIESIASLPHPEVEGVTYTVSWQYADDKPIIPKELLDRKDFTVIPTPTRGVAVNRNLTLDAATAPLLLFSDDDVLYTEEYLQKVIRSFHNRPKADFICFRYKSEVYPVEHPDIELEVTTPPSWVTGFNMACRLDILKKTNVRFNTRFGIGAEFPSGEEPVFIRDLIKAGAKGIYMPLTVAEHPGDTTVMRSGKNPEFIQTKGAAFLIIHPYTWPLRMLTHAWRYSSNWKEKYQYAQHWLEGVRRYKNKK